MKPILLGSKRRMPRASLSTQGKRDKPILERERAPRTASGTLELSILRSVAHAARHDHGTSLDIKACSCSALLIDEGSQYPAPQRLVRDRQLKAKWGASEHNLAARGSRIALIGWRRRGSMRRASPDHPARLLARYHGSRAATSKLP
jgi:hypothetical protein